MGAGSVTYEAYNLINKKNVQKNSKYIEEFKK